jgi:hypothetical protein
MRNLKKALALVMVFALVLGTVASAASFTDVDSSYGYVEEVELLADLGVLAGFPDGSYQPEATITRVQAAAVIYRILTGRSSAAMYEGATKFYDVAATYWGTGYINYCADIGAIGGYPDGSFRPDQAITVAEYESMLVRALGLTEGKTLSYPNGYIALADANLINEDIPSTISSGSAADRGLVAKLTYNTMVNATYQTLATKDEPSPKIIEKIFKIVPYEGIITGTQFEGVATNTAKKFRFDANDNTKDGTYTFEKVTADMIGTSAKVYLKTDSAGATSVYAVVATGKNLVVTVPMADIKIDAAAPGDYYKVNGVKHYITLPENQVVGATTLGALAGTKVLSKVTIISNDGDDTTAEYVFVKSYSYTEYQQTLNNKIYTKDYIIETKSSSGTAYDISFDSTIVAGDKVLVYKNAAGTVAEIIKCSVTQATLDGLSGSGDSTKYTFAGATKSVVVGSTTAQKLSNVENLGKVGKFVVAPFFNLVVETSAGVAASNDYYYLKAMAQGSGFDEGKTIVKVVNTQGVTSELKVKSGATLDGAGDMSSYTAATNVDTGLDLNTVYSLVVNSSNEVTAFKTIEFTDAAGTNQKVPNVLDDPATVDVNEAVDNDYDAVTTYNIPADAFTASTGLLKVKDGGSTVSFRINSDSVCFVKVGSDIYAYQGTFPATVAGTMDMTFADVKTDAYTTIKAATFVATQKPTPATSMYGMLLSTGDIVSVAGDKAAANFKVAIGGEIKTYTTTDVAYTDVNALLQFTDAAALAKGALVEFSLTADGKISLDSGKHAFAKVDAITDITAVASYSASTMGNLGYVADLSGNLLAITDDAASTTSATDVVIYNMADDVKIYEVKASDIGAATVSARAAVQVIKNVTDVNRTKVAFLFDTTSSDSSNHKVTEIYVIK